MIPSKNMHDHLALKTLNDFTGKHYNDRRHMALAVLSQLMGIQQFLDNDKLLEISPTTRMELERIVSEVLTCVDVVLSNR